MRIYLEDDPPPSDTDGPIDDVVVVAYVVIAVAVALAVYFFR